MLKLKNTVALATFAVTLASSPLSSFAKENKQVTKPTLFYTEGASSLSARILAHEVGYHLTYEKVDLKKHMTASGKDFYTVNPKGAVPALHFPDHSVLTENCAVLQYIADMGVKKNLSHPIGSMHRYRAVEACNFIATDLHSKLGLLFHPTFGQGANKDAIVEMLHKKMAYMDKLLGKQKYIAGNQMSFADPYAFYILRAATQGFKLDVSKYTNIVRYYNEIGQKRSVMISLKEEGLKM